VSSSVAHYCILTQLGVALLSRYDHHLPLRWRSTISSRTLSRLVLGVTPGDWYSQALYQPTGAPDRLWKGLREGEIGLSEIAAGAEAQNRD
jgi:hypothetical protein